MHFTCRYADLPDTSNTVNSTVFISAWIHSVTSVRIDVLSLVNALTPADT